MSVRAALIACSCIAGASWIAAQSAPLDAVRRVFDQPPGDARPMMRWWWFGPAVTEAQLSADLEKVKAAGIGGVEIQPVYPLTLDTPDGARNLPYLSDEFFAMLGAANTKAAALGLRLDLTLGSGWPFGGPTVGILDAASRLRLDRVVVPPGAVRVVRPAMTTGESWIAAFVGPDSAMPVTASAMSPLAWPDGQDFVLLPAAKHPRQVWTYIAGRTGMQVKRPSVGAEGYVLSHYDRGALDRYLDRVGARLLQPFGARLPFAIFCDSLEVYDSDWTQDFHAEFARRRGYDIVPLLPALSADRGEAGAMAREDWGHTLTELLDERFIAPLAAWAHQRGTKLRIQGYGIPPATVSSNAVADLPEGEGHHWRDVTASRWASSAAHLYDKPAASSETWTWLHSPSFRATPLDLKAEADRHFLQGITQLIGHGWPSTPRGEAYPGWRFYAAGAFTDANPWWLVMPDVSRYLQRVSAVLRQGRPGNDVALYLPISDAYAHASLGRMHLLELVRERIDRDVIGAILDAGLGFDLVDDGALARGTMQAREWAIGASRFSVILVPSAHAMPVETLAALERFADAGGVVIATGAAPVRPAGRRSPDEQAAFQARVKALFAHAQGRAVVVPDDTALGIVLQTLVTPRIRIERAGAPADPGDGRVVPSEIGVIERRVDHASVFFVANTSNETWDLRVRFLTPAMAIGVWDPVSGHAESRTVDGKGFIPLTLAPHESRFLVYDENRGEAPTATAFTRAEVATERRVLGPWTVTAGATTWTESGASPSGWQAREATRHFSGVATYETVLNLPGLDRERQSVVIDFGEGTPIAEVPRRNGFRAWLDAPVREAALVDVNGGRVVAPVWAPPYRADITAGLQAGDNRIRIRVGNTAMNHMAGQSLPNYRLLNLRYGERFAPQDTDQVQVLPSGITRPVHVLVR